MLGGWQRSSFPRVAVVYQKQSAAAERGMPVSALDAFGFLHIAGSDCLLGVLVYCDESGKFRDHPVVSFGAVIGTLPEVQKAETEWKYCLRETGLKYLTMKEALDLSMPLSAAHPAQGENSRIVALLPFVDCLKKNLRFLIGIAIHVQPFHTMAPEARKHLGKNPQYAAFTRVVIEAIRNLGEENELSIVCDDEEEVALKIYHLYRKLKLVYPVARKKLVSLSLADDEVFVSLQGADLVASLYRLEARKRFLGEDHYARMLFERLRTKLDVRPQAGVNSNGFFGAESLSSLSRSFVEFEQEYGRYGVDPWVPGKG